MNVAFLTALCGIAIANSTHKEYGKVQMTEKVPTYEWTEYNTIGHGYYVNMALTTTLQK